ncbi:nitroreductase family deazaflavin-dependent oxidoreductase [Nocardia yunnanensis]|uniref:Nitroreductase family deazaflavin-dependent oxidoreductase n=1 Tax=Nocardia yunnanensis TaxID=2382165 RepID=A0A386ZDL6_9NOCA|nr:nitroreductase family deazaflavin-dependent oxidoreductase [Nocardia yunnanensis]AYF75214.1 nitroreductase family deazaflavin-dependent oxidoreductase [Nocardia yunnanensis]
MTAAALGARLLQTRWFVRAPILLFRARLGFLFGHRLLLLEHVGRKSGQPRYVALETVARPTPTTLVIASGFGSRAQWYRNLLAHPACHVTIAFHYRTPATARPLTPDETNSVLTEYQQAHPRAYHHLSAIIESAISDTIDNVPLIELTLSP